jgi:hypothetical protein
MDAKSIKQLSDAYFDSVKDETVCVYDRYAGCVDGAEMVLNKIEDLVKAAKIYSDLSTTTRFFREVEKLIKELKGETK